MSVIKRRSLQEKDELEKLLGSIKRGIMRLIPLSM